MCHRAAAARHKKKLCPKGEVSADDLSFVIGDTPHNPSSIGPFTGSFSNPPTQAEMQAYAAWGESLRQALIRRDFLYSLLCTLHLLPCDPSTQSELQAVKNKIDELIGALRR